MPMARADVIVEGSAWLFRKLTREASRLPSDNRRDDAGSNARAASWISLDLQRDSLSISSDPSPLAARWLIAKKRAIEARRSNGDVSPSAKESYICRQNFAGKTRSYKFAEVAPGFDALVYLFRAAEGSSLPCIHAFSSLRALRSSARSAELHPGFHRRQVFAAAFSLNRCSA